MHLLELTTPVTYKFTYDIQCTFITYHPNTEGIMNIEVYVVRIKPLDNALKCKSFIAGITYGTRNT